MSALVEKVYWWWMLRTSSAVRIRGIQYLYISAAEDRPRVEIQHALSDALDRISIARGGFGELVTSHLRFVAALDAPSSAVLVHARGYVSPFQQMEATNSHFLACRLIWAATYIRLSRDAIAHGVARNANAIRQASYDAQVRFTRQFPDAADWVEYLERHPSGI